MTKITPIFEIVKKKKLNLYERITNKTDNNIAKTCLQGLFEGRRKRGKPRKRWIQDIKEWMNTSSIYIAREKLRVNKQSTNTFT